MTLRIGAVAIGLAAVMAARAGGAWAAGAAEAPGAWTTDCDQRRCVVARALVDETAGRRFATFAVVTDPDGSSPALLISTPLGIAVDAGVRAVVGGQAWDAPVRVCFPDGCQAGRPLSADDLALLSGAGSADLRYFPFGSATPIAATVPLGGLAAALEALPRQDGSRR